MTCATCPLDRQSGLCLPLRCVRFLRVAHQDYRQGMLTLVVSTAAIAANRLCAGAGIRLAFVSSRGSCELARLEKIIHVCFYIAQYPVRWTTQRPVHSSTNSSSMGSILQFLATQQLCAKINHSYFHHRL